jgi:hypothetical protein
MKRFLPLDSLSLRAGTGPCRSLVPGPTKYVRAGQSTAPSCLAQHRVPSGAASSPQNAVRILPQRMVLSRSAEPVFLRLSSYLRKQLLLRWSELPGHLPTY